MHQLAIFTDWKIDIDTLVGVAKTVQAAAL